MKALRKCACVAVQLVVTTALLFQQCPIQAIALGLERGSGYVEIPAGEEDAGAADDSSAAPSNDGDSNEAAPASPKKDGAEATSGADDAVGAYSAKQNVQSDDDATNSGDDAPASTSDEELVWNRLGTLEWSKDVNNNVILRPADGAGTAIYEDGIDAPEVFGQDIESFITEGDISVGYICFENCRSLRDARFSKIKINTAVRMFSGCDALAYLNLSALDTSAVTDMTGMFYRCSSLCSLDLSSFDTSSVIKMGSNYSSCGMFQNCSSLSHLDLSSFDTSSVRSMGYMFAGCSSLSILDLSCFDTSSVEDMSFLFSGCSSLSSIDLSSFNTSSTNVMTCMFSGCASLVVLDLSSFDTSAVLGMGSMFSGCSSLTNLNVESFDTSSVGFMADMFCDCSSLVELDLSSFDTHRVSYIYDLFKGCSALRSLDLSSFDSRSWEGFTSLFDGVDSLCFIKIGRYCDDKLIANIPAKYKGHGVVWENLAGDLFSTIPPLTEGTYSAVVDIDKCTFDVDLSNERFTGSPIYKTVNSRDGLKEGEDYSVSYSDNVRCGTATIKVVGAGVFRGEQIYHFSIERVPAGYTVPTGLKAVYGQILSDVKLPEGFSWEDPSLSVGDPGENTFKCKYAAPDDNHAGADGIEVKVRVTRPVEASMFSVDAEGLAYTGKAHEPAVSSKVVPEGSFSISYRDNVAAGKAVAVVKGSGFYTGTCEVPFTIAKAKPSYKVPAGITAIYGQKLSDVKLPEGFSWEDSDTCVDWYGSKAMKAVFAPSDTENYEIVKDIAIPVFVGRDVISVPSIDDLVYTGSIQVPQFDIDGVRVVSNAGGIDVGEYSVELALDDPKLDCWEDGSAGNKTIEYKIVPADINSADIAPISPCPLKDGKAEPAVSVAFGGRELSVDHDFTVSYFDNEKVGTASVSIEGKGNFAGEKTVFFQIAKGDLGDCLVTTKRNVYLYGGSAVEPRIFVSSGDAVLREGVDYKLAYSANIAVGTGHATISGIGDFIGSQTVDFAIVDAIDLNTYCSVHVYDAFYTGDDVCPRVDVRLNTESYDEVYGNGGALRSEDAPIEGQDYTVSYEDNVEPGMATAVVRGRGRYVGEVRVQFHILRKSDFDLSDCSVRLDPPFGVDKYSYALKDGEYSFLYTGSAVEPDVCVSLYGESGVYVELRNGVDYEVSYSSNTEPGSATAVVRGNNGFSGSQSLGFNVVRKLSVADLLLTKCDFEQSVYQLKPGFALTPKLKTSPSFVEGADYALSYSSCDKVGSGLVTVTGIGRYTGSVVVEVPIVESLDRPLLSDCCFDKIEDQVYTGSEIYPRVVLRSTSGGEVDQTRECSLRYSNNVNVGKATVTASESASNSSYIGEVSTDFNILPADIDDAYFVSIGDVAYTGNEIEPDVLIRFNGKTLVKGTDYDLTYSDNVKVGTAHVVVAGKGNFSGTREMTFKIVRSVIEFDQDMVENKTVSTRWTSKVNTTVYRIVLDRGGMVRIRTGFLSIDTVLCSIKNENGDIIDAWAPTDDMVYGFFALPAGTYYFEYVGSPKTYGGSVYASYSVTPFGEPANTIYEVEDNNGTADGHTIAGDATPVEVGRFFAGSNYYATTGGFGDIDYFKFTVTKRGRYSMSLATKARLMFALTDAQGNILNNRDTGSSVVAQSGSEQLAGLDFGTLEPGTYYVRVLSNDRTAVGLPYYGFIFDSSEPEPAERGVGRVSGDTRYDTMASLAGRGNWAVGGSVILASGANYPDALAASSLAGGLDAPILLTDPSVLSDAAKSRLESFCPSRVFIVGGSAAVSPDVERQVKELLGSGCAVFRVAGQTRYETSLVAAEINPKSSDTVIVATGGNYADALSVSPYAFASGSPVVLCDKSSGLTAGAMDAIRSKAYSKAVIVGGAAAVPASVESQLRSAGVKNITRLSGVTRYETSTKIADFELKSGLGFTMDGVLLATGKNFPDALSAGPLAGRSRSPLLLVDPGASYASSYLSRYKGTVRSATVVGGAAAVPERDRLAIAQVLGI